MRILVLNGSPKGKYSITLQTVRYLQKLYPEHTFDFLNAALTQLKLFVYRRVTSPVFYKITRVAKENKRSLNARLEYLATCRILPSNFGYYSNVLLTSTFTFDRRCAIIEL